MKTKLLLCLLFLSVCACVAQTFTYSTLATPGTGAYGALAIHDNILYGYAGGGTHDGGLMFSLTTAGKLTTLYNFGATSTDGSNPVGAPNYQTTTGDWYGITTTGGKPGHGTIFKLTSKNKESTLYAWSPYYIAHFSAEPSMVLDSSGNLYGIDATNDEGDGGDGGQEFKVTSAGAITQNIDCDEDPAAGPIIRGTTLYYTFTAGGDYGAGSIQTLSTGGVCTLLYSFTGGTDGGQPLGKLTQNTAGDLFGTTQSGGQYGGGVVFEVSTSGEESVLYNFCALADCADGGSPGGPLVMDTSGNFYGINSAGVYEVTPSGVESLIYADSALMQCGESYLYCAGYALVIDTNGNMYGINNGVVFKLKKN